MEAGGGMSLFEQTTAWLLDMSQWSGTGSIPQRLGEHVLITVVVVAIAVVIAIPVGIFCGHVHKGGATIIAVAGAARAIPTLGLLTLAGLWLGIGLKAPIIALVVLAIPPLLAGAFSGVNSVDASVVKSSRAMGMTEWQVIQKVEIPLALPLIMGGLRSAVMQVIATATLAAYIADSGLGRYIFAGLKTQAYGEMIGGAVLVILLALAGEALFAVLQHLTKKVGYVFKV